MNVRATQTSKNADDEICCVCDYDWFHDVLRKLSVSSMYKARSTSLLFVVTSIMPVPFRPSCPPFAVFGPELVLQYAECERDHGQFANRTIDRGNRAPDLTVQCLRFFFFIFRMVTSPNRTRVTATLRVKIHNKPGSLRDHDGDRRPSANEGSNLVRKRFLIRYHVPRQRNPTSDHHLVKNIDGTR